MRLAGDLWGDRTMRYSELAPCPALAGVVRCFWFLTGRRVPGTMPEPALPDGCTELIFNLADPFVDVAHRHGPTVQPLSVMVGQITGPIVIAPTGRIDLVAVRFEPHGAAALFGPMGDLTGRWVAVEELVPRWHDLGERLAGLGTPAARAALMEDALGRALSGRRPPNPEVAAAVGLITRAGGRVSIEPLARALGMNRRRLERRFAEEVGLSPKLLARIVRFQRVFQALKEGPPDWARIAAGCGYYDQSHLIREFRAFAGGSPAGFLASDPAFTRLFTARPSDATAA